MHVIDVAVPEVRNTAQNDVKEEIKYTSLCTEMQRKWKIKHLIIPVITGAIGIVTKGSENGLEFITGKKKITTKQLYLDHRT